MGKEHGDVMSSTGALSKTEWRDRFRDYRQNLSGDRYAAFGTLIGSRVLGLPVVDGTSVIHVYWPLPEQGEVDTRPLIGALRSQNVDVVLPVVTSYDPATPTMEHRRYEGPSKMSTNRWGIREPKHTTRVAAKNIDVVLVPALGVARDGTRIGQGAGYYDAFLKQVDIPMVALTYEACFVSELPSEPHDVAVTHVVTEQGTSSVS